MEEEEEEEEQLQMAQRLELITTTRMLIVSLAPTWHPPRLRPLLRLSWHGFLDGTDRF